MASDPNILLLEDDALIAFDMELQISELGYNVLGPYSSASKAIAGLDKVKPDAALLDFNLSGNETSESVAFHMLDLGIPFAFITGHASVKFHDRSFKAIPLLSKPCSPQSLEKVLAEMLDRH